jgi:nickel/cobalt transporter (NicO) family protein
MGLEAFGEDGFLEQSLLRLIDGPSGGITLTVAALLTAASIGALHALGPGHGKALIGAYLAGSQGRPRDAVALGGLVAVMHSASVLVLGSVLYLTQRVPGGEALGPVLRLLSATAITAVGASLLAHQVRGRRTAVPVPASLGRVHEQGQAHAVPHEHQHAHELPAGLAPLSRSGVLAIATSGGLLPSPAAFLVLATALAMGRSGFGLALVAAFSLGLAATLTAVGLAILSGRQVLARGSDDRPRLRRFAGNLPIVSAVAVLVGGLVLAGSAIVQLI